MAFVNPIPISAPNSGPQQPQYAPQRPSQRGDLMAALLQRSTPPDYSSVGSPVEGFAKALTSGLQGYMAKKALAGEQEQKVAQANAMADLLAPPLPDGSPNPKHSQVASALMAGAPADMIATNLDLGPPPERWEDAELNGMYGQRNSRDNRFDPFPETAANEPPEVSTFYDEETGMEYKAQWNPETQTWDRVGGLKSGMNDLTAVDKKAILEADEAVLAGENVISALDEAIALNKEGYSGPLARQRGYLTSQIGSEAGIATEKINQIVTSNALEQLKLLFGAMPTEGERKILLEIQGSVNMAPEVRESVWTRAKQLAEARVEFNRERATEIRGGDFYGPQEPEAAPPADGAAGAGAAPVLSPEEDAAAAELGLVKGPDGLYYPRGK